MKFDLYRHIKELIENNEVLKKRYENLYQELTFPAKTILLEAGKVSQNLYYIKQGCVRLWFNQDGKDITLQFFFEGHSIASIESFLRNTPSLFSIETIEPTTLWVYKKSDAVQLMADMPALKDELHNLITERLINYTHLFLSRIKDTPQQRYENLVKEYPEIIKRVPQHYIASYLGITPVSLSRIRNRR